MQSSFYSDSTNAIHLSVQYDNSRWRRSWGPSASCCCWPSRGNRWRSARSSTARNIFELRHRNLLKWPRLHVAVALEAVSHIEVKEERVVYIRTAGARGASLSPLRERSEFGMRLFVRSAALPPFFVRGRQSMGRLTEVWMAFGRRGPDAAIMRRCVESASAVLLNVDGVAANANANGFFSDGLAMSAAASASALSSPSQSGSSSSLDSSSSSSSSSSPLTARTARSLSQQQQAQQRSRRWGQR